MNTRIIICVLFSLFGKLYAQTEFCPGSKYSGVYMHVPPQVLSLCKLNGYGGNFDLSFHVSDEIAGTTVYYYTFTPKERKDYRIMYEEYIVWVKVNGDELAAEFNPVKDYKTVNNIISGTGKDRAFTRVTLASGFKASGTNVRYTATSGPQVCPTTPRMDATNLMPDDGENMTSDQSVLNGLQYYPNPIAEKSFFVNVSKQHLPGKISITSIGGNKELIQLPITSQNDEIILPDNITSGMYILSYIGEDGWRHEDKLIVP
ncbi:MAG: T9SS type A sorting domain-containing protein [Sporocytophaga sp.]|uniref:T9SS type A sorting domain-containing protein n=1 Tax=Sporocytophaga sp. TaxID=2231183 RepID=UPI001B1C1591|nr:T9SS type A sorting domain-containing protein [Sporocytophaga sp.]MBO9701976.1 T9SS type A sorting domain-containing protein [Sporocytophaga sp.]